MTILCATDLSSHSRAATRLAAGVARRKREDVVLVHAVEPMPLAPSVAMVADAAWEADMLTTAQRDLELAAQELRATGLTVETRVAEGYAAGAILEAARATDASLIVVGSHGRRGAARLLLGSCAEKVARTADRPVLVARDHAADVARWDSSVPLRLALAIDGSLATRAVFYWARTAAPASSDDVTLVRVYWPPQEGARYGIDDPWQGNDGTPRLQELIERDVRRESAALAGSRLPPLRLQVMARDGGEEVAAGAATLGVDALVIGMPRDRRGHWTPVSPKAVLRTSRLPVFCIPEGVEPVERRIPRFRSVLIASDLSDLARQAILPAYGLLAGGGQAHLCHVYARERPSVRPMPASPGLTERERADLEEKLRAQVPAEAAERGIGTHVSVLEGESVAEEILQAAERVNADAVAIASHGRSGLGRLVLGSVAEEVARRATRPVLLIHANEG
ncbi:MAG TPA: universal stress protein [Polyangia bacterium]|nr:universal stress protein [Polyangia bacterium]